MFSLAKLKLIKLILKLKFNFKFPFTEITENFKIHLEFYLENYDEISKFFNYFFVVPTWTFDVYDHAYWLTFVVMLLVGLVISSQAARLREQISLSRQRERETQLFYSFNQRLSIVSDHAAMTTLLRETIGKVLNADTSIWLPDQNKKMIKTLGAADVDNLKEQTVAQWAFQHQQPAGIR